ncbi:hypothetical protein Tco_1399424 [Tanacetum coccineum]
MRRMSNFGGRFAKKTGAEKKSASSCSSGMKHVISECTESINTHQETNGEMVSSWNSHMKKLGQYGHFFRTSVVYHAIEQCYLK